MITDGRQGHHTGLMVRVYRALACEAQLIRASVTRRRDCQVPDIRRAPSRPYSYPGLVIVVCANSRPRAASLADDEPCVRCVRLYRDSLRRLSSLDPFDHRTRSCPELVLALDACEFCGRSTCAWTSFLAKAIRAHVSTAHFNSPRIDMTWSAWHRSMRVLMSH